MKERSSGLENTVKMLLEKIKSGEDFVVNKINAGGRLMPFPYQTFDCEPHVCDFKKAGVLDEDIAFYFAYLLTMPEYEVVSSTEKKEYFTDEKAKMVDHYKMDKIEDEIMPNVWKARDTRLKSLTKKDDAEEMGL